MGGNSFITIIIITVEEVQHLIMLNFFNLFLLTGFVNITSILLLEVT